MVLGSLSDVATEMEVLLSTSILHFYKSLITVKLLKGAKLPA